MLTRSERSLDLLQGILVFLGFYHYHCMSHAQFNNLTQLAVSLVGDMELSSCPKSQERRNQLLPLIRCQDQKGRTNEEQRALIGIWYMSSNAALTVKQLAPVSYTKYIDQCLKELDDAAEYETDRLAVQLVRIQHLTNKIFHFHGRDQMVDDELPGIPGPQVSAVMRLEALRMELDRLRNALPLNLKLDDTLSCHYNSAYLRLFEPLLVEESMNVPDAESQSRPLSVLSIFEVFSSFTAALKAWFDDWLAIPVCSYFYLPEPVSAQLIHACMMLSCWARIAGPSALRLSSAASRKEMTTATPPRLVPPAFSGVPECPDLSVPQSQQPSTSAISSQTLNTLRSQVLAQPDLQLDIFSIVDAMVLRCEAASKEMAAATGGVWENDTWDLAAEHLKIKRVRLEKWCEIVAIVAASNGERLVDDLNSVHEESGRILNVMPGGRASCNYFDWPVLGNEQGNMHWENELFDELMRDVHPESGFLDIPGDWGRDSWANQA
ncbi:hypothetical protein TCE0_060f18760 [Talaromyces pinophilus]|uniref:Uncharacterized protein n=1 Tax=Talaromyces pinophilus TaxID=128442 RepID=A0A6V8HP59_TALPI|nr:hypothetical protein TCE0_060f18760 [Talaromyces pinophilus]